jgi:hypothetical protein
MLITRLVTICTTALTINRSTSCPLRIYVFRMILTVNSDYFLTQR